MNKNRLKAFSDGVFAIVITLLILDVPFPAALLGQRPGDPVAVMLYGANLVLVNAVGIVLWIYAFCTHELREAELTDALASSVVKVHAGPILVYGVGIVMAAYATRVSLLLYALVPAFFILPNPWLDRKLAAASAGGKVRLRTGTART